MKIHFLGAAETVTGSKFLLERPGRKVLVDCGLFQGYKHLRLQNWAPFPIPPAAVDAVVLTHAHIDHSGYLPILVRDGFKGPIYATEATFDLCEILLRDSGRIHEEDARRANKYGYSKHHPALPLYTEEDAIGALKQFKTFGFGVELSLGEEFTVSASRAGHILGSAILTFRTPTNTVVFSGDLGRKRDPIMKKPATIQKADYLILESTYGNRLHSQESAEEELGGIIRDTARKGGTVLIPSFAVGRTQMLLYLLYKLKESGSIPDLPVYLDSPMAQDATNLMEKNSSEHILPKDLCRKVCSVAKYVQTPEESKSLFGNHFPSVIISASGMAEGGRVLHHIRHYGPNPHNAIVFAGFQAPMTRGDRMVSGAKEVKIHGKMVPIHARVEILESLSSHADYGEVLTWLKGFVDPPRKVFLVHGERDSLASLKE
jgi:metallo-beta-lactamase family protein